MPKRNGPALALEWPFQATLVRYYCSEFAVTSQRVMIKTGSFKREALELFLRQIESAGVNQCILGRLLDYGTMDLTGSGGTKRTLPTIAFPLAFRKAVLEQIAVLPLSA